MSASHPRGRTLIGAIALTALPALPLLLGVLSWWVPALRGFCARRLP